MKFGTKILIVLLLCPMAIMITACESPGEKIYDQANDMKKEADDLEGEERTKLYLETIELFKQAVALEPENPKYWSKLAACYKNVENYGDSIITYQKAIELDPDESDNYDKLMGVYIRSKHFKEAREIYDHAVTLDVINRDPRAKLHMDERLAELEAMQKANQMEELNKNAANPPAEKPADDTANQGE